MLPADPQTEAFRAILEIHRAARRAFEERAEVAAQPQAEDLWTGIPDALLGRVLPRLSFHCAASQVSEPETTHPSCIGSLAACFQHLCLDCLRFAGSLLSDSRCGT